MARNNVLPPLAETGIIASPEEVADIVRITAAERFVNNTSRLRKFVCGCETHVVDDQTGKTAPGPKIFRGAASLMAGMGIFCNDCAMPFQLEDTAARRRLYRGCKHCTNPDEHDHGVIEEQESSRTSTSRTQTGRCLRPFRWSEPSIVASLAGAPSARACRTSSPTFSGRG